MAKNKLYYPNPGAVSITDSELAYSTLLLVSRNGQVYNVVQPGGTGIEGGLYVYYAPSLGTITFDSAMPFYVGETINVIFEI